MKLAISLLLLLAGTGFGQSNNEVHAFPIQENAVCKDGDGNVIPCSGPCPTVKLCTMELPSALKSKPARKPDQHTFKLPSAGPGDGGGVSHQHRQVPFHIGCIITCPPCQTTCPPDPVDVPAVQEPLGERGIALCVFNESDGVPRPESCDGINGPKVKPTPNSSDRITLRWTCKDKTRILEHDEQTPPKYYCRKAQL